VKQVFLFQFADMDVVLYINDAQHFVKLNFLGLNVWLQFAICTNLAVALSAA
jgi:hypothetical protein